MATNMTNFHSHSLYCDGHAPLKDFVEEAIRQGFTSYGISPHAPLPWITRWTMMECELPVFLYEMKSLKEEYKNQIELYTGLEIDYIDENINAQKELFRKAPLDYRIGSVHMLYNHQEELIDIDLHFDKFKPMLEQKFDNDAEGFVDNYFRTVKAMLRKGGFDIVGHIDKISYNIEHCVPGITESELYMNHLKSALQIVKEKGYILEVNTKAYARQGITFIGMEHFPIVREMEIPVVVNSDSHFPALINNGREVALARLRFAGIDHIMELHHGEWISVKNEG